MDGIYLLLLIAFAALSLVLLALCERLMPPPAIRRPRGDGGLPASAIASPPAVPAATRVTGAAAESASEGAAR